MLHPARFDRWAVTHRPAVRRAALLLLPFACTACLAGPSTALGGGPIGRAPNLRATDLLEEPDSTRGVGFIIASNRRDFLEESRVELNAAARSYERLFGARPEDADIRLTSDEREVRASIRIGTRPPSSFTIALGREAAARSRLPESMRIASVVVLATSREWLFGTARDLLPGDRSGAGWMERQAVPAWLRAGLLQNVAVNPLHDVWLAQLGRERASLPTVASLFAAGACDAACLAPFIRIGGPGSATEGDAVISSDVEPIPPDRTGRRRGRLPPIEERARFAASTYSLVQFMARREGPAFMRTLVATALAGGDVSAALGSARSFSAEPADIDRQWRVWLATFAYPDEQ